MACTKAPTGFSRMARNAAPMGAPLSKNIVKWLQRGLPPKAGISTCVISSRTTPEPTTTDRPAAARWRVRAVNSQKRPMQAA